MTLKKAARTILVGISAVLLISALLSYWALSKVSDLSQVAAEESEKIGHLLMTAARVQTDFQIQIQEFKNILLRGEELDLWKKHRDGFKQRGDLVQEGLDQISQAMEQVGMDKTPAEQLLLAHSELTFRYGEASKLVKGMGIAATVEADKSVRGLDRPTSQGLTELRAAIDAHATSLTEKRRLEIEETAGFARNLMLAVTVLGGLAVVLALQQGLVRLMRQIGGEPAEAVSVFARMSAGDLTAPVPEAPAGSLMAELGQMQQQLRVKMEEEQRTAAEVMRIKRALDCAGVSMMLMDAEGVIRYRNDSMNALLGRMATLVDLSGRTETLRGVLQGTHAESWADTVSTQHVASTCSVDIGQLSLTVRAQPVLSAQGELLGVVLEWQDLSEVVMAEAQIQALINAALVGDFSVQIPLEDKKDFYLTSAEGLNHLTQLMNSVLGDIGQVLKALAAGDLSRKMESEYQGVLAELKEDTNQTIDSLRQIVGQIRQAAQTIGSAAHEVAEGNVELSERIEEQASSLEETASSMEEINATVRQNAANAQSASGLAQSTNRTAQEGGAAMQEITVTMHAIHTASKQIESIISVIDSIAFQTNILALNAAVEAARAGEQGRGFAVVATEVRNLAHRSSQAAHEIKELIGNSVSKVEDGVALIDTSSRTMRNIVASFEQLSSLVGDIAISNQEQATGIAQVAEAVTQMDTATQQSAARVEEAAAAARLLSDQAEELNHMVDHFRMTPSNRAAPLPARKAMALPSPATTRRL